MPIPGMNEEDEFFNRSAHWRLKFLWLPKRSAITGRRLWLQTVYEGVRMITSPGTPVFIFKYHETVEHLIWQLKHG